MIIFNKENEMVGMFSSLPNKGYEDTTKWTIAELPKGESFNPEYSYSPVDGVAVRGDLIPRNFDEEARLETEYQATKYQTDREYPPIGDQLDALFKAGAFPDDMAAQIQAAKDAHPKP